MTGAMWIEFDLSIDTIPRKDETIRVTKGSGGLSNAGMWESCWVNNESTNRIYFWRE